MSYDNFKIKESDISTHGVVAAPDRLSGTAQENKAVFDRLIKNVVAQKFNSLLEQVRDDMGSIEIPHIDETLKKEDGVLSVNCAESVEENNTLPITAAAVYQTVGNIEALLKIL